MKTKA
jgi:gamma-glutamyl hydrolase